MGEITLKRYNAYLQSDEWRRKRKEKAIEQNYTCEICGKVVPTGFNIHHKTYRHLGHEPLNDLMFLCESCHMELHRQERIKKANKAKKEEDKKTCFTCKYSQIMTYTGKPKRQVLYCNLLVKECGAVCKKYKIGALKEILTDNKKKKKRKTAKKRANKARKSSK